MSKIKVLYSRSNVHQLVDMFNLFLNKPLFLCVCSTSLLKTLREKCLGYKSFHSKYHMSKIEVLHSRFNVHQLVFLNKPFVFMYLPYKSFENTEGKGGIARDEQFLLFPQCLHSIWRIFYHLYEISNCRLKILSVWKSLKFVVWE